MDFSNYKFNPSTLGSIMTNSRAVLSITGANELETIERKQLMGKALNKKETNDLPRLLAQRENSANGGIAISETTKKELRIIYLAERYGSRYKLLSPEEKTGVPQMIRGIKTEHLGLQLVSEMDGKPYYQYKKTVENEYLKGKLDIIDSPSLETATKILDIKSAGDIKNFYNKIDAPFTPANIYQMQAYFGITGISDGEIVHCLVGEPNDVIEEQKELLFKKWCPDGVENNKFLTEWQKAYSSMMLLDIPKKDRIVSKIIDRDDEMIQLIYDTIRACRKWLNEYHQVHEEFTKKRYI